MADRLSLDFWRDVATRFRNRPLVAFDLYNEPYDIAPSVWRDGGRVNQGLLAQWDAVGMQQLYDAVRCVGANNLVLVSGLDYAYDLESVRTVPLDGFGIVRATHVYCRGCNGRLPSDLDATVLPTAAAEPVVISEFGTDANDGFNAQLISWAESHGLGWLAWSWTAGPDADYALFTSWDTHEPTASGAPVRSALLAARPP
jgi:hypothetical protein